ncbi:sugar transferase [Roseivivax sp. CAU 1753]
MTASKRAFDILGALTLGLLLLPLIFAIALAIRIRDGSPVFYLSERMKTPRNSFQLVKFRTMSLAPTDSGVSGGDKTRRITRTGAVIRKNRLDELPQLWNILRGDLSFVGPRPPLRQYTNRFPELYSQVLRSRPGVTGIASVYFHRHEELLLKACQSVEETDSVYCRSCIPRKARLDLIYQRHRNLCMDIGLMFKTVLKVFR